MRFAAMGELTASIAHEINQPLGAILSNADAADIMLRNADTSKGALREALHEILADIRRDDLRAHEVIRRLRALLENHEVTHEPLGLHPALYEALGLLEPEARRRGIMLEAMLEAADDRIVGDTVQLQQVLLNLAINAMDASEGAPVASRRVSISTADRNGELQLTVADTGSGIPAGCHELVFESFYTTKPRGMGLGLGIVRAIVESHGGRVTLEPRDGGGTLARVCLPRVRPDSGTPQDNRRRDAPRPAAALAGR
jgi:signal transduction histidine kinase